MGFLIRAEGRNSWVYDVLWTENRIYYQWNVLLNLPGSSFQIHGDGFSFYWKIIFVILGGKKVPFLKIQLDDVFYCFYVFGSTSLEMWHQAVRYFRASMFIPINTVLLGLTLSLPPLSLSPSPLPPLYTSCRDSLPSFRWIQETPEGEIRTKITSLALWHLSRSPEEAFSRVAFLSSRCHHLGPVEALVSTMDSALDRLDAAGFLQIWQHFDLDGKSG